MDELTYQETADGGFNIIKGGSVVGYIPKDHPQADDIKKRIADGHLPKLPRAPAPNPPVFTRRVDVDRLGALLVQKGVVTAQELIDASDTVKG